ncbi:MAG: iron ABC transporter permease [Actinobacteria bacterium]|nr:iron ABC transporter permease [Actinomycetota bacterium]MCL6104718.1 iron ABC transporter permease [Actinomycetota bacterium]
MNDKGIFFVALVGLLAALTIGLIRGPTFIPLGDIFNVILGNLFHPTASVTSTIILDIRLPRVLAASVVGGALAVAGVIMQALLRNPLADPYVIGASSGAGLGATIAQVFFPALGLIAPGAFLGALGAILIAYALARGRGRVEIFTLILAGYALSIILGAVSAFLMMWHLTSLSAIFAWELGGIHGMTWGRLGVAALLVAAGIVITIPFIPELNAFLLGEEEAHYVGVSVERSRLILLATASLMTAGAVYLSGLVGFVGLVIPHVLRRFVGSHHRRLLPLSFLVGAIFLVLADTLAENVPGVGNIPLGLVTALVGGPYFLWLLTRTARSTSQKSWTV